jgi:hypothetical protein
MCLTKESDHRLMQQISIISRLFIPSKEIRRFFRLRLWRWVMMLSISLLTVFLTASPIYAATVTSTISTNVRGGQAHSLPANKDHTASLHTSSNSSTAGAGNLQTPYGIGSFLYFTDPSMTVNAPGISTLWATGLAVVDAFMIALIMMNAVRIMMSGSIFRYADVAETLPRVLLALVVAHLSFDFITFFANLSNGLCSFLVGQAGGINPGASLANMFGFHMPSFSMWDLVTSGASYVLQVIIEVILFLVQLVLMLMLFAQLITRIILIDLYIVFSAPCIACWALPGRSGQPVTRMWLQGFLALIFVQLVQIGGLIMAELVMGLLYNKIAPVLTASLNGTPITPGSNDIQAFMGVVVLWFILKVPGLLQAAPMQTVMAGGQMVAGAVGGAIGGGVAVAGAAALAK